MVKVWPVHRSCAVRTLKLRVMLRVLEMTAFCISSNDDDVVLCNLIVWVLLTDLPSERCVLLGFLYYYYYYSIIIIIIIITLQKFYHQKGEAQLVAKPIISRCKYYQYVRTLV